MRDRNSLTKKEVMELADALDRRRQAQIKNQIEAINRLMAGPRTYDDEMRTLHEQLAERDAIIEDLRRDGAGTVREV